MGAFLTASLKNIERILVSGFFMYVTISGTLSLPRQSSVTKFRSQ